MEADEQVKAKEAFLESLMEMRLVMLENVDRYRGVYGETVVLDRMRGWVDTVSDIEVSLRRELEGRGSMEE